MVHNTHGFQTLPIHGTSGSKTIKFIFEELRTTLKRLYLCLKSEEASFVFSLDVQNLNIRNMEHFYKIRNVILLVSGMQK